MQACSMHVQCACVRIYACLIETHLPLHTRVWTNTRTDTHTLSLSDTPSLSWIIQKLLSPNSSNSYSFICIPGALEMIGPPLPLKKKWKKDRNVPQTICLKMRQEWFCSFQRQRQPPMHNDVSVMVWQIDWETMTLAWETHQWAAAQLWSQRALRHTLWTSFVSQLYEPDKWRHAMFYARQYTIPL